MRLGKGRHCTGWSILRHNSSSILTRFSHGLIKRGRKEPASSNQSVQIITWLLNPEGQIIPSTQPIMPSTFYEETVSELEGTLRSRRLTPCCTSEKTGTYRSDHAVEDWAGVWCSLLRLNSLPPFDKGKPIPLTIPGPPPRVSAAELSWTAPTTAWAGRELPVAACQSLAQGQSKRLTATGGQRKLWKTRSAPEPRWRHCCASTGALRGCPGAFVTSAPTRKQGGPRTARVETQGVAAVRSLGDGAWRGRKVAGGGRAGAGRRARSGGLHPGVPAPSAAEEEEEDDLQIHSEGSASELGAVSGLLC